MTESCIRCTSPIPEDRADRAREKGYSKEEKLMSFRDIAKALGVSHVTVMEDYNRAMQKLRNVSL